MHPVAPDGGIYIPETIPSIPAALFKNLEGMSLTDCAYIITTAFLGQDISPAIIKDATSQALDFDIPLKKLSDSIFSLELFHGPTLGMRDIGTRFLAALLSRLLPDKARLNIIAATAGDTGMALADAMKGIAASHVYILHSRDVSSHSQRTGFTLSGDNTTAIEVKGSLDECMHLMKQLLADREFCTANKLICGNTLNLARLLPVAFPFFHAIAQLQRDGNYKHGDPVLFAVPSGSQAVLTAGVIAKRMGLGNVRFVVACSPEHSFTHYLRTGEKRDSNAMPSIAGALDVSYPGNLPRLLALYGDSAEAMSRDIAGEEISDDEIIETMQNLLADYNYFADPHTAATMCALERQLRPGEKGIVMASVHPAKFSNAVTKATHKAYDVTPRDFKKLHPGGNVRHMALPPTLSALKKYLTEENLA